MPFVFSWVFFCSSCCEIKCPLKLLSSFRGLFWCESTLPDSHGGSRSRASNWEFQWATWGPRSFSLTAWDPPRSESAHPSPHFVLCHYQSARPYKLSNSLAHSSPGLLRLPALLFSLPPLLVHSQTSTAPASTCRLGLFMVPRGVVIDLSLLLLWLFEKKIMLPEMGRNRVWRQSKFCICISSQ